MIEMTFEKFMTNEEELYLRITKKSYLYNRDVIKQYLHEPHLEELDEFFKCKLDNNIVLIRNNKLMEKFVGAVGAACPVGAMDDRVRVIDYMYVAFDKPNIEDSTDESEVIVILINNNTMVMDSPHTIFRYKAYAEYALKHNFNVKFTQTTSCDSVKIIKYFVDRGFSLEFGVDKEPTPDRVCVIESIYALLKCPNEVRSNA